MKPLAKGAKIRLQRTMQRHDFLFAGTELSMLPSGALWWRDERLLCVSDLHLGKSERMARRGGDLLPPYEARETLGRLEADIETVGAATVVCLGDSFDDLSALEALEENVTTWITRLMAGRRWVWIEGNHDPGPVALAGMHLAELYQPPLSFRHIARPGAAAEISGHYHPKARVPLGRRTVTRPCLLYDSDRVILPAYGTYTGGLRLDEPVLDGLMRREAVAVLTGPRPLPIPMRG